MNVCVCVCVHVVVGGGKGSEARVCGDYLHDDLWLRDVGCDRLVWQDRTTIDIDFILDSNIVTQY